MQRTRRYLGSLLLASTMIVPVMVAGCEAGVRYYDADHRDYHRWNRGEDRYYRLYWSDRHENYREWTSLNEREQSDYWRWRRRSPLIARETQIAEKLTGRERVARLGSRPILIWLD